MSLPIRLTIQSSRSDKKLEKQIKSLVVQDLLSLDWSLQQNRKTLTISPPEEYSKSIIRESMLRRKQEALSSAQTWINQHEELLRSNLATGAQAFFSPIIPSVEICTTQEQHNLFRLCRYYWSSPYSDYVGRRIKLIIRDDALKHRPIIGIAALGSSIIHIPERDTWIGWNKETRTQNIILCMDAYVLGAMPPYNVLLGGKLISYILASNEIRQIFRRKYSDKITQIKKITSSDLVCLFTTSLYGRSSQYNRINYEGKRLYNYIGQTKGFGSLHLTDETFQAMQEYIKQKGVVISNRFGDGPNWRMRVIRTACDYIGLDADMLLNHSFKRNIYAIPLANNYKAVLLGETKNIDYCDYPYDNLVDYWHTRWLNKRKEYLYDSKSINEITSFNPSSFSL